MLNTFPETEKNDNHFLSILRNLNNGTISINGHLKRANKALSAIKLIKFYFTTRELCSDFVSLITSQATSTQFWIVTRKFGTCPILTKT